MNVEKENTWRSLKDEPLLVANPILCRIGIHKWVKWSAPKLAKYSGIYYTQERFCVSCNLCSKVKRRNEI